MTQQNPNTKPACTYPVENKPGDQKGNKGESTGGTLKPSQRPSNR